MLGGDAGLFPLLAAVLLESEDDPLQAADVQSKRTEAAKCRRRDLRGFAPVLREATGGLRIDALTGLQVQEHSHLSASQVRGTLRQKAPLALAARRATTPEQRSLPYDPSMPGEGVWSLGYLFDTIHIRDPWMHRIDICRATGREPRLTPAHDGRIVADVVADWARRHGEPVTLVLSGAAGAKYVLGVGGPQLDLDAIEFCRTVSGRELGDGLLSVQVPF